MIRIGTDCSGIGSPEEAFKRLGEEYDVVFGCERDKWARMVYEANHRVNMMFEDMTARDNSSAELDVDLYVAGIPCQSFSLAGKRLGESDARGTLFYNFWDFVKQRRPKVFMIENVAGLLSDKKGRTFRNWLEMLGRTINYQEQLHLHEDNLGYNLHWRKLNSVDFGVPQNRERVFLIGIRGDLENRFVWPAGVKLEKTVKDILEEVVDEKYYLSEQAMKRLLQVSPDIVDKDTGTLMSDSALNRKREERDMAPPLRAHDGCGHEGDSEPVVVHSVFPRSSTSGTGGTGLLSKADGTVYTVSGGSGGQRIEVPAVSRRIRRLTPLECFRLQGFGDEFKKPVSDSQLYRCAGNTITVNVLEALFRQLLPILKG